MAKRESLYKLTADAAKGTITYTGPGGEATLVVANLSEEIRGLAVLNGFKQKIADKGALSAGDNGKVDQAAKAAAVRAELVRLGEGGAWNVGGSGGGGMGFDGQVLIHALCLAKPDVERATIEAKVKAMDGRTRAALLGSEQLALYVDEARKELTKGVDTDSVLGDLGIEV